MHFLITGEQSMKYEGKLRRKNKESQYQELKYNKMWNLKITLSEWLNLFFKIVDNIDVMMNVSTITISHAQTERLIMRPGNMW